MPRHADFDALRATELFCPQCRRSQPVRRRLLAILPHGARYEYRCTVCGSSVGTQTDDEGSSEHVEPTHE